MIQDANNETHKRITKKLFDTFILSPNGYYMKVGMDIISKPYFNLDIEKDGDSLIRLYEFNAAMYEVYQKNMVTTLEEAVVVHEIQKDEKSLPPYLEMMVYKFTNKENKCIF